MAIGYAELISYYEPSFWEKWMAYFEAEPRIDFSTIEKVNNQGQTGEDGLVKEPLETASADLQIEDLLCITFKNIHDSGIFLTIHVFDKGLIAENYSLDQLCLDEEYLDLHNCLLARYKHLRKNGLGIGFIFDERGYSDEYINVSSPL